MTSTEPNEKNANQNERARAKNNIEKSEPRSLNNKVKKASHTT